ncbi:MAG: PDDEXK nuclease domain-containing protein [Nanoarchaeota archaeon]|nr:PDDEXK nuclease domain-containing protein [Nanoarchaeota archaeon]
MQRLSSDLTLKYGKGFGIDNIERMRRFYLLFPKSATLWRKLSWSHYRMLLRVKDKEARGFYISMAEKEGWGAHELDRQISSLLYERLALSKNKNALPSKAKSSSPNPEEQIKDPYVLEFLSLKEEKKYSESQIEQALIDHLQEFLLELGKGYAFVARQKRISINNEHYYVDLVFYNRALGCLILIDVKSGKFTHADAGQMNFYLNYFRENEVMQGENEPIGIVLCTEKDNTFVKYSLGGMSNRIFASKYHLGLPSPEDLKKVVEKTKREIEYKQE